MLSVWVSGGATVDLELGGKGAKDAPTVPQMLMLNPIKNCVPPADAQLWCVFRPRFALSKEGFCFKLITVRRTFIKSIISHPMIIRESPHSNRIWLRELHLAQKDVCTCNSRNQSVFIDCCAES